MDFKIRPYRLTHLDPLFRYTLRHKDGFHAIYVIVPSSYVPVHSHIP